MLPGKFLDTADRTLQLLLGPPDVLGIEMGELLLQLVAGQLIDRVPHMLGIVLHGVDHAGNDEGELDFVGSRRRLIAVRYQFTRTHRNGRVAVCMMARRLDQPAGPAT